PCVFVDDEDGVGGHDFIDYTQAVSLDGSTGFSNFDNSIAETFNYFCFGGTPRVKNIYVDISGFKIFLGGSEKFGGNFFTGKIFGLSVGGVSGYGQNPTGRTVAYFGVNET
ncbi:hypothetical protein ADUPG1_005440, partial [Aduncisulcus paluster]